MRNQILGGIVGRRQKCRHPAEAGELPNRDQDYQRERDVAVGERFDSLDLGLQKFDRTQGRGITR